MILNKNAPKIPMMRRNIFSKDKTLDKSTSLGRSKFAQNGVKSIDYTPWFWSILVQSKKFDILCDFDEECSENNFDDEEIILKA